MSSISTLSNMWLKQVLVTGIKGYQWFSRLWPKQCRFYPTCSQYMIEALQQYGAFKGLLLGVKRITRCHPFNHGGVDPIPPKTL